MSLSQSIPILQLDNQPEERLTVSAEFPPRTKHIQRKYFFIRDRVKEWILSIAHVDSDTNLADIFTKPMKRKRLNWDFCNFFIQKKFISNRGKF